MNDDEVMDIEGLLKRTIQTWQALGHPALMERFIFRNGRRYKRGPLPRNIARGKEKECFSNAAKECWHSGAKYVEGFGFRPDIPLLFHHAWLEIDGKAVDPTWKKNKACQYYGVAFDMKTAWEIFEQNGYYGIFDNPATNINLPFMLKYDRGFAKEIEAGWPGLLKKLKLGETSFLDS